jgi:cytochrome oxidase Cu insertion factor (SCO1/SenC/PrrC family)
MNPFRLKWLLPVLATLAVAGLYGLAERSDHASRPPSPPQTSESAPVANPDIDLGSSALDAPAPDFRLRDQNSRWRSLGQLRGKVVLLAFVDSHCTSICPLTSESMVRALRLLGPAASRVQLLGINANPLATQIADVASYTRAHHMQGHWWFLTGPEPVLARVWRAYHVYVAAVHGDIDHQPIILMIDASGREREIYLMQMRYGGVGQQAEVLADGIARILPGHVVVRQPVSLRYVAPLGPDATARLPAFGRAGEQVVLRPAQPHLVLFFASWLNRARLPVMLAELERYATLARRQSWPEPIAVDELPTEAPTAEWRRRMAHLADELHIPVVADPRGRLADGYGAQDLPWFALTVSGRILWQHDGWLSFAQLTSRVRAARQVSAARQRMTALRTGTLRPRR